MKNKFVCDHPWTHFEVNNPNGNVTMCCDNATVLGNVNEGSVEDIWNGERFQSIRKKMANEGAHLLCPHTCPILQGGKRYRNLSWYEDLPTQSLARQNAAQNEIEFDQRLTTLESKPRWMRFAYSYACNLDCYHCYQRDDALMRLKLPASFMQQITEMSPHFQVVLPFGGEPFLYRPVLDFMENDQLTDGCKYYFITNATLFTERVKAILATKELLGVAVSLDAATEESFDALRLRGRKASWNEVLENLEWLKQRKNKTDFEFSISMTLNRVNCEEIERFVALGLKYDAEPDINLVANPDNSLGFQKNYLKFDHDQFDEMFAQIDRSIVKVTERGLVDSEVSLKILRQSLILHRRSNNNLAFFMAKDHARKTLVKLPENLQNPIRNTVQRVRSRLMGNTAVEKE